MPPRRAPQEVGLSCGGNVEVLVGALDRTLFEVECGELDADRAYVRVCLMEAAGAAADGRGPDAADGRDASARARQAAPGTCLLLVSAASPAAMGRAGLRPHPVPGQDGWRLLASRETEEALSSGTLAEVAAQVLAVPATEVAGHVRHAAGDFFFCRTNPLPKLVCVGGVHVSIHLTRMAKMLGYHTVVIDPRGAFATGERSPVRGQQRAGACLGRREAFKGIALDESTALCALRAPPEDRRARAGRRARLARVLHRLARAAHHAAFALPPGCVCEGYGDDAIARVFGPIGLDLKGREPAEIALAIMSEITAVRYGGSFPMAMPCCNRPAARRPRRPPRARAVRRLRFPGAVLARCLAGPGARCGRAWCRFEFACARRPPVPASGRWPWRFRSARARARPAPARRPTGGVHGRAAERVQHGRHQKHQKHERRGSGHGGHEPGVAPAFAVPHGVGGGALVHGAQDLRERHHGEGHRAADRLRARVASPHVGHQRERGHEQALEHDAARQVRFQQRAGAHGRMLHDVAAGRAPRPRPARAAWPWPGSPRVS